MPKINTPAYEPTPFQIAAARAAMIRYKDFLIEADESFGEDERLLIDTLDGETDCIEIIDAAVNAATAIEDDVDTIERRIAELNARKARLAVKSDRLRSSILETAQALGTASLKRAVYTLTVNKGRTSVEVTNVDELPQGYFKTVRQADKVAIKASLEAKADVPGAQLVTGHPSLTLRTK